MTSFPWTRFMFLCLLGTVCCNKCTNVLSRDKIQEVVKKEPCTRSYTARCGWLSLNYCTFYHRTFCDKKVNETITTYYIVTDCCKGYIMGQEGTCIKKRPGMIYPTTPKKLVSPVDPDYKHEPILQSKSKPTEKNEISGGVYAGIGCGLVLMLSIAVFTVIAVRKRKKKKRLDQSTSQNGTIFHSSPSSGPIVRTSYNARSPSVQISREVTPSSLRMITPPRSPIETAPVQQSLLDPGIDVDNIPESDI
ncbi:hypothetical protein ACF0H5_017015 [Mactra antiquata]